MAWVFDVDACLIDSITGTSLRPLARELLTTVRDAGGRVIVWSAGGADYARRRLEAVGIGDLVDGFYDKSERGPDGRWLVEHLGEWALGATFVDDRPEEVHAEVRSIGVSPYIGPNPHDRGLARALAIARGD